MADWYSLGKDGSPWGYKCFEFEAAGYLRNIQVFLRIADLER